MLHKFEPGDSDSTIGFERASCWIQIHGLPMRMQTTEVAKKIVGPMGVVEKVEIGNRGFIMGKYLCVHMTIDITKPLCNGRIVQMGGNRLGWVDFRYECLPIFCYRCGKLENDDRDFSIWIESKKSLETEDRRYGPWLQADTENLQRPYVVEAP